MWEPTNDVAWCKVPLLTESVSDARYLAEINVSTPHVTALSSELLATALPSPSEAKSSNWWRNRRSNVAVAFIYPALEFDVDRSPRGIRAPNILQDTTGDEWDTCAKDSSYATHAGVFILQPRNV